MECLSCSLLKKTFEIVLNYYEYMFDKILKKNRKNIGGTTVDVAKGSSGYCLIWCWNDVMLMLLLVFRCSWVLNSVNTALNCMELNLYFKGIKLYRQTAIYSNCFFYIWRKNNTHLFSYQWKYLNTHSGLICLKEEEKKLKTNKNKKFKIKPKWNI